MTEPLDLSRRAARYVTLFSLVVLLLGGGLNLVRAWGAWHAARRLNSMTGVPAMPLTWLAGTSLIWASVLAVSSWGLWRRRAWGWLATLSAVTLYHGHIWLNHLWFDRSSYARQSWPLALVDTGVTLLLVWGFLYWPSIRTIYQDGERMDEFGSENKETA